jgi:glyoxylase I family protein
MHLHHIGLNCADQAASERFYTEHFGFARSRAFDIGEGRQIIFLKLGESYLELFPADGPAQAPVKDGPVAPGVRHLAFKVADVDAQLAAMGDAAKVTLGPFSFDDAIPGWRTVWVADPDGNIVEISQGYTD